jgi:hypothetical protein
MPVDISARSEPWRDPRVIAALESARAADEIWVLQCPHCGWWSYYDEEADASRCRHCCCDLMPLAWEGDAITLADYWTDPYPFE